MVGCLSAQARITEEIIQQFELRIGRCVSIRASWRVDGCDCVQLNIAQENDGALSPRFLYCLCDLVDRDGRYHYCPVKQKVQDLRRRQLRRAVQGIKHNFSISEMVQDTILRVRDGEFLGQESPEYVLRSELCAMLPYSSHEVISAVNLLVTEGIVRGVDCDGDDLLLFLCFP